MKILMETILKDKSFSDNADDVCNAFYASEILDIIESSSNFGIQYNSDINIDSIIKNLENKEQDHSTDISSIIQDSIAEEFNINLNTKMDSLSISRESNVIHSEDNCCDTVSKIIEEQLSTQELIEVLVESLTNKYRLMITNPFAYSSFTDMRNNKKVNWITSGTLNTKKLANVLSDFKSKLPDHVILLTTSTILMADNPKLLLQIMAEHIQILLQAFAEGLSLFAMTESENIAGDALQIVLYFLKGYDNFSSTSSCLSQCFYSFNESVLSKFFLSWNLICQSLFLKYVYFNYIECIVENVSKLKEANEISQRNCIVFEDHILRIKTEMYKVRNSYPNVLIEMNKYFASNNEMKRQTDMAKIYEILYRVHRIDWFATNNFTPSTDAIKTYCKNKRNCFVDAPNNLKFFDKCQICEAILESHSDVCECVTCLIGGRTNRILNCFSNICYRCNKNKTIPPEEATTFGLFKLKETCLEDFGKYHISWAIFHHLKERREKYNHNDISNDQFCKNCSLLSCIVARKILNNQFSSKLAKCLSLYFQPIFVEQGDTNAILKYFIKLQNAITSTENDCGNSKNTLIYRSCWIFLISFFAIYINREDSAIEGFNSDSLELYQNDIRVNFNKLITKVADTDFTAFCKLFKINLSKNSRDSVYQDLNSLPLRTTNPKVEEYAKCNLDNCVEGQSEKQCNFPKKHVKVESTCERMLLTRERLRKKLTKKTISLYDGVMPVNCNVNKSNTQSSQKVAAETWNCSNCKSFAKNNTVISDNLTNNSENIDLNGSKEINKESKGNSLQNKIPPQENLNKWVTERLKYIEGNNSNRLQMTNPKKAAKKAKQKQRQEEKKFINELNDLKSQFHDIYFKELKSKERLKESISNKKQRDKKLIASLEINIKKLQRIKASIEKHILELIATVKQINLEFKFAYLPTKEEQENFRANYKKSQLNLAENNASKYQKYIQTCIRSPIEVIKESKNKEPNSINEQIKQERCHSSARDSLKPNSSVDITNHSPRYLNASIPALKTDDSKRIVTIRRINLPNALEPQVTVTAKSSSPNEEDKLLYTFVNGQLVQSNSSPDSSLLLKIACNDQIIKNYKNVRANVPIDITHKIKTKLSPNSEFMQTMNCVSQKCPMPKTSKERKNKSKLTCSLIRKGSTETKDGELRLGKFKGSNEKMNATKTSCTLTEIKFSQCGETKNMKSKNKIIRDERVNVLCENRCCAIENANQDNFNAIKIDKNIMKKEKTKKRVSKEKSSHPIDEHGYVANKRSLLKTENSLDEERLPVSNEKVYCSRKPTHNLKIGKTSKKDSNKRKNIIDLEKDEFKNEFNKLRTERHEFPSLSLQMERLNLQKIHKGEKTNILSNQLTNVSIMDQLNSGVQVENLLLPPGITLTKIDAGKFSHVRQKADSIDRLSQPLQTTSPIGSPFPLANNIHLTHDPTSYILDSNIRIFDPNIVTTPVCHKTSSKSKKKKKKIKTQEDAISEQAPNEVYFNSGIRKSTSITLRNPIFNQRSTDKTLPPFQDDPMYKLQIPVPMQIDQPAAIIKNENGMFTIRNLALHQAVTKGLSQEGFRSYGSNNFSFLNNQQNGSDLNYAKKLDANLGKTIPSYLYGCNSSVDDNHLNGRSLPIDDSLERTCLKGPEINTPNDLKDKRCLYIQKTSPAYQLSNHSLAHPSTSQNVYKADLYQKYCFHVNSGIEKDLSSLGNLSNTNENCHQPSNINTGLVCFDNASILKNLIPGQISNLEIPIIQMCDEHALRPNFESENLRNKLRIEETQRLISNQQINDEYNTV